MGIDNIVEEQTPVNEIRAEQRRSQQTPTQGGTIQVDIRPFSNFEKTDIQFWLMVTQTVLLLYIALRI